MKLEILSYSLSPNLDADDYANIVSAVTGVLPSAEAVRHHSRGVVFRIREEPSEQERNRIRKAISPKSVDIIVFNRRKSA